MRKFLSLALILMLALTSFSGAVAQEDRGEPNITVDSVYYDDWSIEITWLPQDGFDTTDTAMADYLVSTAVAFVKDHPEVKVTCAAQSINIADAMSKLLTQAAAGNAPDVASVDSFYLPLYYDYLQPITDVFEANDLSLDSWFPFAQDAMTNDDDTTCGLNDMNCVDGEEDKTCALTDMNCVEDEEDKTCALNDMNCLGE